MAPEDAHNMDEIGLFCHAQPNNKLSIRKILWARNSKAFALVVNMACTFVHELTDPRDGDAHVFAQ